MINSKLAHGMVPSDVLIRTAILAGLQDLRNNQFLLDYVFNWFENDDLTKDKYGLSEKMRAKQWFLDNNIDVTMNYRADDPKFPLISIGLQSSSEDQSTLGDVNYDTIEDVDSSEVSVSPDLLLGPFTPASYDSATGIVVMPQGFDTSKIFIGNVAFSTKYNQGFVISDIISLDSFVIDKNISINLTDLIITPLDTFFVASLESCLFKQSFQIKCYVQGDPVGLLYLHSIVEFILLRYKEIFLEARGFDRSTISSGPVHQYQPMGVEMTYCRDINLNGYCRQYWPKVIGPKVSAISVGATSPTISGVKVIGGGQTPYALLTQVLGQGWFMENEILAT